jgi:hypothetical protein
MQCPFCHQDVADPCHNTQEMEQRATSHVERCEHALESREGTQAGKQGNETGGGI